MAVAWTVSEKNALALVSTIFYLKFVKKKWSQFMICLLSSPKNFKFAVIQPFI